MSLLESLELLLENRKVKNILLLVAWVDGEHASRSRLGVWPLYRLLNWLHLEMSIDGWDWLVNLIKRRSVLSKPIDDLNNNQIKGTYFILGPVEAR